MNATNEVSSGGVHLRSSEPVESSVGSALDDGVHAGGSSWEVQETQVLGQMLEMMSPAMSR